MVKPHHQTSNTTQHTLTKTIKLQAIVSNVTISSFMFRPESHFAIKIYFCRGIFVLLASLVYQNWIPIICENASLCHEAIGSTDHSAGDSLTRCLLFIIFFSLFVSSLSRSSMSTVDIYSIHDTHTDHKGKYVVFQNSIFNFSFSWRERLISPICTRRARVCWYSYIRFSIRSNAHIRRPTTHHITYVKRPVDRALTSVKSLAAHRWTREHLHTWASTEQWYASP